MTTASTWMLGGILWILAGRLDQGTHEAMWLAADACLAVGIVGLWRIDLHAGSRAGALGLAVAALGRAAFVVAEVVAALSGDDENALLPVGALLTAVGLTSFGVAVLRVRRLPRARGLGRWSGFAPLSAGLYPFLAMFPIVAATGEPSDVAIALWGIPLGAIGFIVLDARLAQPHHQGGRGERARHGERETQGTPGALA